MKKKNIINLIKYYSEKNDSAFRTEAYEIAKEFDQNGDFQLSEYIMALLSNANTFVPQSLDNNNEFFKRIDLNFESALPLPIDIKDEVIGIVNAIRHDVGIHKFLFQGPPGTGKTETAKHVARILNREMFVVDFDSVIDSKLGQTSKNIMKLFQQINDLPHPENAVILFDEIDSIALDRTNSNDLREMGRATSSVLKGLDLLNEKVVLIATTNLFEAFDKALVRRFDFIIDFSRYTREDLLEISEILMNEFTNKFKYVSKNTRLFRKIISLSNSIPYPAEMKNIIKSTIAFSNPNSEFDYLKRLYSTLIDSKSINDIQLLKAQGFTIREIEILSGISKSQVGRELKGEIDE